MSTAPTPGAGAGPTTVKISDLSTPQLSQLKKQLDDEITHLSNSFTALRAAQSRFKDCLSSLSKGLTPQTSQRTILVPLTSSLYVPGSLAATDTVLVDVGTGFFVEKSGGEARKFYEGKVEELKGNLARVEGLVRGKGESLRVVEDALRQRILKAGPGAASAAAATG